MSDIYQFSFTQNNGQEKNFAEYKGKVLLVVNTASKCGFTPQYKGLEELYKTYKGKGFEIIGFPCNQFGGQEPGNDDDVAEFCEMNFGVSFPLSKKVEVNGDNTSPIYEFLKKEAPGLLGSKRIKWNFTKFLINSKGEVVKRYAPTTKPKEISMDIEQLLTDQ